MFFFFKQKTAYEMRISDWSSDVCSSDLHIGEGRNEQRAAVDRQRDQPEQHIDANHHRRGAAGDIVALRHAKQKEDRMRDHRRGQQVKRSEEHTSELQSLMRNSYDVFCLKKKKKHKATLQETPKPSQ